MNVQEAVAIVTGSSSVTGVGAEDRRAGFRAWAKKRSGVDVMAPSGKRPISWTNVTCS